MAKVLFYTATAAEYAALIEGNKAVENALYFVSSGDGKSGTLYKGTQRFSFPVQQVTSLDSVAAPITGLIYATAEGTAGIYTGSAWIEFGSNKVDISLKNAVRHVVTLAEAGSGIYADYTAGTIGILFTFENSDNTIFVSLADLVDVYTGVETNTATVSVDGYNISADVKVSNKANNILSVVLASGDITAGLYAAKTTVSATEGNAIVENTDGLYVAAIEWQAVTVA